MVEYHNSDQHDYIHGWIISEGISDMEWMHWFYPKGADAQGVYYFKDPESALMLSLLIRDSG